MMKKKNNDRNKNNIKNNDRNKIIFFVKCNKKNFAM